MFSPKKLLSVRIAPRHTLNETNTTAKATQNLYFLSSSTKWTLKQLNKMMQTV